MNKYGESRLDQFGNGAVLIAVGVSSVFIKILSAVGLIGLALVDTFLGAFSVKQVFVPGLFETEWSAWTASLLLGAATFVIGVYLWEQLAAHGKGFLDPKNIVLIFGVVVIFVLDTSLDTLAGFLLFSPATVYAAFSGFEAYSFYETLCNLMIGVLVTTLSFLSAFGEPMFMLLAGWLKHNVIGDIFVKRNAGKRSSLYSSTPATPRERSVSNPATRYTAPTNASNRPAREPTFRRVIPTEPSYEALSGSDF